MSEHVRIDRNGPVLHVTLARPERRNAITVAMYALLASTIDEAAADPSVRLISFSGEGQDFAAGNDLRDFIETPDRASGEIPVWRFLRALASCETPLIAAVHGNCVGIGTTMLLHCDLVIAEEGTRFSMPFVDLGLVPEAGSSLLFPMLAGRRLAARYLLLGEPFGTKEALEMGLASHSAAAGELGSALKSVTEELLRKPAQALQATQRLLRSVNREELLSRMDIESRIFSDRLKSAEAKTAISAFFERRTSGPLA